MRTRAQARSVAAMNINKRKTGHRLQGSTVPRSTRLASCRRQVLTVGADSEELQAIRDRFCAGGK